MAAFHIEDDMQTFDYKVDNAVHAAFMALGLAVANHIELAYRLNDFITQEFQFVVTDDDGEDPAGAAIDQGIADAE
ncbi:hypothetical protein [Cypionkella sp.]|uniref:hypothetical protein n=1 Tax=Cypionkella sp. TaxID=2811411 RepID=UPI0027206FF4|nr:hypothetical protein [Cypionkella sp.]MDO8984881.1 hypothetical protein [Cypionkella sp.]MDP1576097.1 hypothetical protein [Cypionkella sp.]MDP2050561.1 hypothetical protein [Cypionkella sp.]